MTLPKVVKDLHGMHIVRLAAGGSHTLALSSTGGVFSVGSAACGQLGRDTSKGGALGWGAVAWPCCKAGSVAPGQTAMP